MLVRLYTVGLTQLACGDEDLLAQTLGTGQNGQNGQILTRANGLPLGQLAWLLLFRSPHGDDSASAAAQHARQLRQHGGAPLHRADVVQHRYAQHAVESTCMCTQALSLPFETMHVPLHHAEMMQHCPALHSLQGTCVWCSISL